MALRDNALKVYGFENLFCAGVKCGPTNSLLDAAVTGDLAGYNAVRYGLQKECLELPKSLIIGAFIDYLGKQLKSPEGLKRRHCILDREIQEELNLYRENEQEIVEEVQKQKLENVYSKV